MMKDHTTVAFSVLTAFSVLSSTVTYAKDDERTLSEALYFSDLPVVLSATRLEQPIQDTPASISVIDQEMIRASGAVEIVDLLRLVPGFVIGYHSGSKFTATYHGMSDQFARDMQVLIDGRSVYDPVFGGVPWSDLPLNIDDIQRIEVIRGPNAAAYGSNAFSGVINFITIHPSRLPTLTARSIIGENHTRNLTLRHAHSSEKMDYTISVNYDENSGFDSRDSDSSDTRWVNLRGNYELTTDQYLHFSAGYSNATREDGFLSDDVQPPRDTAHRYNYQQMEWRKLLSPGNEYSLKLYHNYFQIDDSFALDVPVPEYLQPVEMGFGFDSHRYDAEFQHKYQWDDDLRLAWGIGLRRDMGKSIWTLHEDDYISRNQARAFINAEKKYDRYTLNYGGMYEKYEQQKGLLSPRFAVNYHVDNNNTFRFSASRAYRMPTIYESNANIMIVAGDPAFDFLQYVLTTDDLEPERIDAFEIGYIATIPEFHLTLDAKLYKEKITNIISHLHNANIPDPFPVPELKTGAEEYINNGHADIKGIEIELGWKPTKRLSIHSGINISRLDGQRIRKIDELNEPHYRYFKYQTPEASFNLLGSYQLGHGVLLSAAHYFSDKIYWQGDGDDTPSYHRTDIRLSKEFEFSDVNGEVSLTLQNIGGDYYDFYIDRADSTSDQNNVWTDKAFLQLKLNWL